MFFPFTTNVFNLHFFVYFPPLYNFPLNFSFRFATFFPLFSSFVLLNMFDLQMNFLNYLFFPPFIYFIFKFLLLSPVMHSVNPPSSLHFCLAIHLFTSLSSNLSSLSLSQGIISPLIILSLSPSSLHTPPLDPSTFVSPDSNAPGFHSYIFAWTLGAAPGFHACVRSCGKTSHDLASVQHTHLDILIVLRSVAKILP